MLRGRVVRRDERFNGNVGGYVVHVGDLRFPERKIFHDRTEIFGGNFDE